MKLGEFITVLHDKLSPDSKILTDQQDNDFKTSLERWSNIDLQVPGAIIKPANEADVILTTREALKASIPFVPASGGHSPWSTINEDGFILDLSLFKDVVPEASKSTVTVRGGVLMKELQLALGAVGQFTTVGNGNTVGVIPYFLNGGISAYTPLIGFGSENILSARLIIATGEIMEATETTNPELLWAIRGAGQFFGIVIELVIRTYPLSMIGNPDGSRQLGTYVFLPQQAAEVCRVMEKIMVDQEHVSAGHMMIICPPPKNQQVLLVAPQFFGSPEQAAKVYQPLVDLGPVHHMLTTSTFQTHSDHLEMMCAKGEFKRFNQLGLDRFHSDNFIKLIDLHSKLLAACPGSERSGFTVEWHSPSKHTERLDAAFGNQEVDFWLNVLSWYTDPAQHEEITRFDQAAQAQMRVGTEEIAFLSYTNCTRDDPIEYCYKGPERVAKLKELKKKWDPTGVFTKQLL